MQIPFRLSKHLQASLRTGIKELAPSFHPNGSFAGVAFVRAGEVLPGMPPVSRFLPALQVRIPSARVLRLAQGLLIFESRQPAGKHPPPFLMRAARRCAMSVKLSCHLAGKAPLTLLGSRPLPAPPCPDLPRPALPLSSPQTFPVDADAVMLDVLNASSLLKRLEADLLSSPGRIVATGLDLQVCSGN